MELDKRKKRILESIIRDYVETAEPVGSRAMVRKHSLNISAATVRNEMADLEEMGYLEQPHTSAGRIPSQLGLRYFVDCMMECEKLTEQEIEHLRQTLKREIRDWNDLIQTVGQFISRITNYASFAVVPSLKFNNIQSIQLIPLQENIALLLLITDLGVLLHRKISIPDSITVHDLNLVSCIFNRVLSGKNFNYVSKTDLSSLRDQLIKQKEILDNTLDTIDSLMQSTGEEKILIQGTLNILNEPEFKDLEKLKKILGLLEKENFIKQLIPENIREEVDIRIGKENKLEGIQELSLVFAGFKTGANMGKIGLVGPVRMEYWKAAGTIDSVRLIIEDVLKEYFG